MAGSGFYVPKDKSSRGRHSGGDSGGGAQRHHKEPWGYWLKEKFRTAAIIGLAVGAPIYTLLNYNEYQKLPDHYYGWFPGYMAHQTIKDASKAYTYTMDNGSKLIVPAYNTLVAGPLGWEQRELATGDRTRVYCVDPALSLKGWDSPQDQVMKNFKAKALMEIRGVHQSSLDPQGHYSQGSYANSNLVMIVEASQYEAFAAGQEIGPIVRVLPSKQDAACPANQGYKQRVPEL